MSHRLSTAAALLLAALLPSCWSTGGDHDLRVARADYVDSPDGVEIRYEVVGSGEPTLVFVHGWSCDRTFWKEQAAHFARERRVVTLDLAGHGESGREREEWSVEAFGRDVVSVCDELALQQVVLVGHSMGGPVTLAAAKELGPRVAALVPVDTLRNVEQRPTQAQIDAYVRDMSDDFKTTCERFVRANLFVEGSEPALIERIATKMASAPPAIAIAAMEGAFRFDEARALEALDAPVRCINAAELQPTDVEAALRHHEHFEAVLMPNVGHFPMLEDPANFNRLLERALEDLAPRR